MYTRHKMEADNLTKQMDEVSALWSIYERDFITESTETRSYSIRVCENKNEVILYVTLPPEYPSHAPPKYELSAPWMERKMKQDLHVSLNQLHLENSGECILYQWVEKIRELLLSIKVPEVEHMDDASSITDGLDISQLEINCPDLFHGAVIIDRKSSFQGHVAEVHSVAEVNAAIAKLKQTKKIQNATHNICAYRIEKKADNGTVTFLQDCDDDGETHAGSRMLHLMQILDQRNILVIVSRWYGGIQLGPDRFRHINNAMRQVLFQAGLLKQ